MSIQVKSRRALALLAGGLALALGASQSAFASPVIYENLPTSIAIPPNISWHNAAGPVIADDFISATGGSIDHVTWWGSEATSNDFELVLQNNNPVLGEPDLTPSGNITTGGLKLLLTASSSAYSIPGLFQFDADLAPGWSVAAGTDYWLTVANVNNGWQWAEALAGPTVGSELFNAHSSTGPGCLDGGPHCGPWTDVHTDFAFKITAVPEPATWAVMLVGIGGLGATLRRRRALGLQTIGA
jgi:hypothetical protein